MSFKLLLAAAGFACLAAPAYADGVRFDRAALADPAAAAAFHEAVEQEAERVCRKEYDRLSVLGPTARRRAVESCVAETVETALRSVEGPRLAAARPAGPQPRIMASPE
jgi:UrcA family protein